MSRLRVLVVGTGNVGGSVLRSLSSSTFKDRVAASVLVRPASLQDSTKSAKLEQFRSAGVQILSGDSTDSVDSLTALLQGFHTVISALAVVEPDPQFNLLEAAKRAGVQRFIPSEFSIDTEAAGPGHALEVLYAPKQPIREALQQSGLDYLFITPGLYAELLLSPFAGVDLAQGVVTAPGSFDTTVTVTSHADIGRLTAHLLFSDLHRTKVRLAGDVVTYTQIADAVDQVTGSKVQRRVWSVEDIDRAIAAKQGLIKAAVAKFCANGTGAHWPLSEAWNHQQGLPTGNLVEYVRERVAKG